MITRRHMGIGASAAGLLLAGNAFAQGKVLRVPITLSRHKKPLVELTINGKGPYIFALDTGASGTVIKASVAKELRMDILGHGSAQSIKGSESTVVYNAAEVILGGKMRMTDWRIFSSEGFSDPECVGLLSADLLTRIPCQLDHEAREIRYYLGAEMDLNGFGPIQSKYVADRPGGTDKVYVDIAFGGDRKLSCCLDTGAASPLYLLGDYVREHKLWDKYPILKEMEVTGVNGKKVRTRLVEVKDVQIGGVWIPRIAVTLSDPEDRRTMKGAAHFNGLLGAPFLSAFIVAFTAERQVSLKPTGHLAALAPPEKTVISDAVPESTPERPIIPFRLGDDRRLIFTGKVSDKTVLAFLRTGEGASRIGDETAATLGLKKVSGGYDGSAIDFAGTTMPGLVLTAAKAPKAPVTLGADFLRLKPCALNFEHKYMTLFVGVAPDTTGYEKTAMTRDAQGRLTVPSKVAGKEMPLIYDTGVGYGVFLPSQTVKAHGFWDMAVKPEERLAPGENKTFTKSRFSGLNPVEFEPFRIDPSPVTMIDPTAKPDADVGDNGGWIGIGVIRRFDMIVDAQGVVWLKPNALFGYTEKSLPAKK